MRLSRVMDTISVQFQPVGSPAGFPFAVAVGPVIVAYVCSQHMAERIAGSTFPEVYVHRGVVATLANGDARDVRGAVRHA